MTKWKSVKDGLPKTDCKCWVTNSNHTDCILASYSEDDKWFIVWIEGSGYRTFPVLVTHYIELPKSLGGPFGELPIEKPKRGRPKGSGKKRGRKPKVVENAN